MEEINKTLSKEQEEVVDFKGDELLVRGIAGSGKTLVMLRRAKLTAEKYPERKVAVFTYGRALTNASNFLMENLSIKNLNISTFHSWAIKAYKKVKRKRRLHMVHNKDDFLGDALKDMHKISHRFITEKDKYKDFLKDEITWIKGKAVDTWDAYEKVSRKGRGSEVRVTQEDRKIIFDIFNKYNHKKDYKLDYDDLGLELSKNMDKIDDEDRFDHIFVDEAQDLQQVQLIVLKNIAKKSFFVAADKGQKIYKTSFAWRDIGLNITGGRTKILRDSFRSTKQIIQLANTLQQKDIMTKDEEFVSPILPSREGPKPVLFDCVTQDIQDLEIAKSVKQMMEENPNGTVGILARTWRQLSRIGYALKKLNITYEFVNKNDVNPFTPGVKLCSIHSSKGLEFSNIIIADLNEPKLDEGLDEEEYWETERRLLYVGITRAINYAQLYYYENPTPLLHELDTSYYDVFKITD